MPLIKTIVFTVLVPGSVGIWVPLLLVATGMGLPYDIGNFRFLGFVLIVPGTTFYLLCAWDFVFTGKGTPIPIDPPKNLVRRRLYRLNRNPMYTGGYLAIVGESILLMSWTLFIYAFAVWLYFHLFVVLYEEPHLKRIFGTAYEEYCKAVPRWVPRWR